MLNKQLTLLNVGHNQLKNLPVSIGSCFSLEELLANGYFLPFSSGVLFCLYVVKLNLKYIMKTVLGEVDGFA